MPHPAKQDDAPAVMETVESVRIRKKRGAAKHLLDPINAAGECQRIEGSGNRSKGWEYNVSNASNAMQFGSCPSAETR